MSIKSEQRVPIVTVLPDGRESRYDLFAGGFKLQELRGGLTGGWYLTKRFL